MTVQRILRFLHKCSLCPPPIGRRLLFATGPRERLIRARLPKSVRLRVIRNPSHRIYIYIYDTGRATSISARSVRIISAPLSRAGTKGGSRWSRQIGKNILDGKSVSQHTRITHIIDVTEGVAIFRPFQTTLWFKIDEIRKTKSDERKCLIRWKTS